MLSQLQRTFASAITSDDTAAAALITACMMALENGEPGEALARRIRRDHHRAGQVRNTLTPEGAAQVIEDIHRVRSIASGKTRVPGKRKLDKYRQEIIALRTAGASEPDIVVWLRRQKRVRVNQSTVHRFLKDVMQKGQADG